MLQKIARIEQFHVWGTANQECVEVKYRGEILFERFTSDLPAIACSRADLVKTAMAWAVDNGFTHVQISYL